MVQGNWWMNSENTRVRSFVACLTACSQACLIYRDHNVFRPLPFTPSVPQVHYNCLLSSPPVSNPRAVSRSNPRFFQGIPLYRATFFLLVRIAPKFVCVTFVSIISSAYACAVMYALISTFWWWNIENPSILLRVCCIFVTSENTTNP